MLIKHIIVELVAVLCYVMGDNNTRSLTFVIDDTISMTDEISQVKQKTHKIFNAVHNSNESQIDEFIIVTFNDFSKYNTIYKKNRPHARLLVIAKDETEFKKALYNIKVGGGNDCPEMAMAGIDIALKHSKPNSYIYIFTDAAAKDYEKFERIKSLSQKKMIQITFLLTGKCLKAPIESYVVYDKLATATSGQVFHINKQDVEQIIEYVIANIQSKRTTLARKTFKHGCENEFRFTVDSKVWYVLISVSAEDPVFRHVIGPDGVEAKIEELVHTDHTYIVKLKGGPGEYTINITSCDETSIVVTASTSVSFIYGFSPTKPIGLDETSTKPLPDKQSYLAIELDNIEKDVTLETVELRDIDDNPIIELPLNVMDEDKQLYSTELFDPPKMIFKIAIIGYTKIKEKIVRVSPTTVECYRGYEAKKNETSLSVTILAKDEVIAEYDKPITLKCKVEAVPEPKITWEDELDTILPSSVYIVEPPDIYVSTLHVAKLTKNVTFFCKAKNDYRDEDSIQIILKNKTHLKVLYYPTDVTIEIDKPVQFNLKIDASPPAAIIWYENNNTIVNNSDFDISSDGSVLTIKNVQPRLEGIYFVDASNGDENKRYEFKVTVNGTEKPIIDKNITIYTRTLESNVDLICRVIQGKPKPVLSWEFDYNNTGKFVKLSNTYESFHIDRIRMYDTGTYRCNAINEIGMDFYDVQLVIKRKISDMSPLVSILKKEEVDVDYDKPVTLKCQVKAYPEPRITWEDELHNVLPSTVNLIDPPYIYVSTLQVEKVKKNTTFICKANNVDEYSDSIQIIPKIVTFLTVLEYPTDVTVEFGKSVEFNCKINSLPPAKILWYQNNNTIENNDYFKISSDSSILKIKNILPRLAGPYLVEASNGHETMAYQFIVTVVGTEKPVIDKNITSYTKDLKSNVDLLCRVIRGKPKPLITWEFDYNYSGKFINLTNTNEIFHIDNTQVNNIGTYRCNAVNEIGMDVHNMQLFLEQSPSVKIKPRHFKALKGAKVKLDCIVEGLPVPKVKWLVNDKEITYGSKYKIFRNNSLSFTGTHEDSSKYICEATNYLDTASKSVDVIIYEPVKIETPVQSIFNATLRKSLTLPCRASGYPKPAVNWIYYSFESKEPRPQEYYVNKSLEIEYVQLQDEGTYICIATNEVNSDNITYVVNVPVGAWIKRVSNNKPEVVIGDPIHKLKCSASGSPKPTITWTINESTIESDSRLYKVEANGNLILSNITIETKGTYTCKAENSLASDKIEYEVNVHSYPPIPAIPPKLVVLLTEGTTNSMLCGRPLKDEDFVRWFKDGKLIKTGGQLTLINVTELDTGYYTCRVNTMNQSFSYHNRVIVGTKPKFITVASTKIIFKEGALAKLDCSAAGKPPPTTKWTMDDRKIPITSENYEFVMNKKKIKPYSCIVSNEFGTINRSFDIAGGECLLNLENDLTARQPMLLPQSRKMKWPLFEKIDGFLKIPKYKNYQIFCPESFISYSGKNYGLSASISCIDGPVFQLGENNASFSEIICQKPIIPLAIKRNNDKCSGPGKKYFHIGFDIKHSFRAVYAICFDSDRKIPVFANYTIHPFFADMVPKHLVGYFESTHINLQLEDVYNCRNQLDSISAFTGETLDKDICCFSRRQLVNPKDILPGIPQIASYHYLNVVPQWSTCGTENWDEVERRVRSYMLNINKEVYLWTGIAYTNTLVSDGIYLKDKRGQQLQVPQYIWKVIYEQVAVIHINVPNLKTSQTNDYILCKDICNTVEWMKSATWHDVDKGFIYCCDIKEFETAFNYESLFVLNL